MALFPNLPGIAGALPMAGFSMMYAVTGAGYGLTAVVTAWALHVGSPIWAVFGGVAATLVLTAVSAAAERRQPR